MPAPAQKKPTMFARPSRKSHEEPPGLDAFAAGAGDPVAAVGASVSAVVPSPNPGVDYLRPREPAVAPAQPAKERETLGMNVRFTQSEKAILEALANKEGRSMHQVLKRLLRPVLQKAAEELEFGGS